MARLASLSASSRKNWIVFSSVAGLTLAAAGTYFAAAGLSDESVRSVLRHSGRVAYALFVLVLLIRPLQQLTAWRWAASLRRNRRYVGIAFAAVMAAHLVLIATRVHQTPDVSFGLTGLVFGAGAYAMTALMFITSFDGPARALGPKAWKRLHRLGLLWIGFVFVRPLSLADLSDPEYYKITAPVIVALLIRGAAWIKMRRPA